MRRKRGTADQRLKLLGGAWGASYEDTNEDEQSNRTSWIKKKIQPIGRKERIVGYQKGSDDLAWRSKGDPSKKLMAVRATTRS